MPAGQGKNRGGPGQGQGQGMGRGRGIGQGKGSGGQCVCTSCGETITHERGVPCNSVKCPKCGAQMYRQ